MIFMAKILCNNMRDLEIRLAQNKKELDQVIDIRKTVFVNEQNVPLSLELDGLDGESEHIIVLYKNETIGCARIRFNNDKAKLERIAILKKYREKGFGKRLMHYLINYCRSKGVKEIYLHSQIYMKDFYKRLGFRTRGKPFMEAGIEHVKMYMKNQTN